MPKKVVLVGHCGPDSSYLRMAVQKSLQDVTIIMADDDQDLQRLLTSGADLLLVNRTLDFGFTSESGVDLIKQLRAENGNLRAMLISNYPEAQAEAVAVGALPGFGKREIGSPRIGKVLREAIGAPVDATTDKR